MILTFELLTSESEIDDVMAVEEASFTNSWTRQMYVAELGQPGMSFCYLARDADREVVGFCSLWRVVDELHINSLAVVPRQRRAGIATALLTHALGAGSRSGAVRATLEVRQSNEAARLLYARMGFTEAGVRRAYYANPLRTPSCCGAKGWTQRPAASLETHRTVW